MKLEIKDKIVNKLLKRTEVRFEVDHKGEATPTRIALKAALASKIGCAPEVIVVNKFKTVFGKGFSKGVAHQYKTEKDMLAIEAKHIVKRFAIKEEPKKEEKEEMIVGASPAPIKESDKEEVKEEEKNSEGIKEASSSE